MGRRKNDDEEERTAPAVLPELIDAFLMRYEQASTELEADELLTDGKLREFFGIGYCGGGEDPLPEIKATLAGYEWYIKRSCDGRPCYFAKWKA